MDGRGQPEWMEALAIVETEEVTALVAMYTHAKLNDRSSNHWAGRVFSVAKKIDPSTVAILNHFESTGEFLKHRQAGMNTILHTRDVQADGEVEGIVLHGLRKCIARREKAFGLHRSEAQKATPAAQRPVRVIGIMVPLPLRSERKRVELV